MTIKTLTTSTGIKISIELFLMIIAFVLGVYGYVLYTNWQNGRDIADQVKVNQEQNNRLDKVEKYASDTKDIVNFILILQKRMAEKLQVDTSNPLDIKNNQIKNLDSNIYLPF